MSGHPIPMHEIVGGLSARADSLAAELLPAGRREGREWKVGSVAGEPGRSLSICLDGDRAGIWADFSRPDQRGDALDLVAEVLFAGDKRRAVEWAISWLGLDGRDPRRLKQTRAAVEKKDKAPKTGGAGRTGAAGRKLWFDAQEKIQGTPVEHYLLRRGISLAALGRAPRALRYGEAKHPETGRIHPAMLAAIVGPDGKLTSCHRTYLQHFPGGALDGSRAFTDKLRGVEDAKLTLGRYLGGAIRLWRGLSTDPETGEVKPLPPIRQAAEKGERIRITLCEGIEDGLTLALADPARRVWACVSLSNMASVDLPDAVADVVIAADNDSADNKQAMGLLDRVFRQHRAAGRRVVVIRPPAGCKDFNDLLRGAR